LIEAGKSYLIRIVPTVHKATAYFRTIELEKRGCRFIDERIEGRESIIKYYSKKTCIFECTLRMVVKKVM
jgi:hypothetical protein